jgi:mannosyltransferase OCH1-like enzyme
MPIPKKIHYCWLSGERMPKQILDSIKSWKQVMPDYELILWDKNKFDVNSVQWVAEACSVKKWALAADYIRLYAVYTEGGIYFDSDVYTLKSFDDFLNYDFFSCFEWENSTKIFKDVINSDLNNIQVVGGIQFEAAIFGGIQGHPFLMDCMNWYENHHYILPNGKYNDEIIAPQIYAAIAQKYGFRYIHEEQKLKNNMIIFPQGTKFYSPFHNARMKEISHDIYAIHWHAAAWVFKYNIIKKAIMKIKNNDYIRKLFGKKPVITIEKIIDQNNWNRKNRA